MSHWYFIPIFDNYLIVLAIMAAMVAVLVVGAWKVKTSGRRARVLSVMRALALGLLLLAMLQPSSMVTTMKKQSATLVVMIDTSRSLLVPDAGDGKTRWELLKGRLDEAAADFAELGKELEIKFYEFDSTVRPIEADKGKLPLGDVPTGTETAIGAALDDVLRLESRKRLVGIILISDGAQQSLTRTLLPLAPVQRMGSTPLYTVRLAVDAGQRKDVSVRDLIAGPTVYIKNQLAVFANLRIDGLPQEINVELLIEQDGEMQVVAQQTVRAEEAEARIPVTFHYAPQTSGEFRLSVRAAQQPGELITTNNEQSTYITVLEGGLRVLYVEGSQGGPRIEQRFLRKSLAASPDLAVDYLRIDSRQRDAWPDRVTSQILDRFAAGKYDVTILGDVDSDAFKHDAGRTPKTKYPLLDQLREAVEKGSGLIMLGGRHSFGPGGYFQTPLAELLPVMMDRTERQLFDDRAGMRTDVHHQGKLQMRPADPLGLNHPIMQLAPGAGNQAAWERLPPLLGANRFPRNKIKPAASILAESEQKDPLLVAMPYGSGRVLAFAGDTTWRWWLTAGEQTLHKRFWRQVVLWLAQKKIDDSNVWIRLDSRRFQRGQMVRFTAGVNASNRTPVAGASFTAVVQKPDGKKLPVRMIRQGNHMIGTILDTSLSGDYLIRVEAQHSGRALGRAKARFYVQQQDLELDNAAANPELLKTMAQKTAKQGGRSLFPEEIPALLAELKQKPKDLQVEIETRWTFGREGSDATVILLVFVALLGVEWFFRKKWGLV